MKEPRTNICLNMIVKNETKVLERLLRSVKDCVDYYVIVDTGSTDGTPELIKQTMDGFGIEGEVHSRPWVNFGVNRQQALDLAVQAGRSEWLLFIDADEELGVSDPEFWKKLESGVSYELEKHHSGLRYAVPHLINVKKAQWRWEAPVHNYLVHLGGDKRRQIRKDAWIIYHPGQGAKSHGMTQEEKYLRDARLLEEHLKEHPNNARSQFYLAQSYKHAGHFQKAYDAYRKRVKMNGWIEEQFMAQLEMGRVARLLEKSEEVVLRELLAAYEMRPVRAEPLFELASYYRLKKMYAKAYLFARAGVQTRRPNDTLFIAQDVYDWRLLDELGVSAYWVAQYAESKAACEQILKKVEKGLVVSEVNLNRIKENLMFSNRKLAEKSGERSP